MKKYPKGHIRMGRASGFHWCCIAYFLFRGVVSKHWKNGHIGFDQWVNSYVYKLGRDPGRWNHKPCPIHQVLSIYGLYRPEYHTCEECGWMQLDKKQCNLTEIHESVMRPQIRQMMVDMIKDKYTVWCQTNWGKIGVETAKEVGYRQ